MKLLAYAQLVRLPNVFTALADIALAGWALGLVRDRPIMFACLLATSTLLYWSGMVWNDYFDIAQDRMERPGRPIPSGRVAPATAALLGGGMMLAGVALAFTADLLSPSEMWYAGPVALALVAAIFLYDAWLKRTWLGPVAMGACRFLNVLLGLALLGTWPAGWGCLLALAVGVYITGVTWFARTEARASNARQLLAAALVILAGFLLALGVPALARETNPDVEPSILFPYLLTAFAFFLGLKVVPAVEEPAPRRVQPAVRRAVLGLVLFDAILASALVGTMGLSLALLLLPGMLLGRWLYST